MAEIYYYHLDESLSKEQVFALLNEKRPVYNFDWQEIIPDKNHTWLTAGLQAECETFIPLGTKEGKAAKGEGYRAAYSILVTNIIRALTSLTSS
jgi:predicted helicase